MPCEYLSKHSKPASRASNVPQRDSVLQIRLLHHLRFGFVALGLSHVEKAFAFARVHAFASVVGCLAIGLALA
jgi:hypothetical protein